MNECLAMMESNRTRLSMRKEKSRSKWYPTAYLGFRSRFNNLRIQHSSDILVMRLIVESPYRVQYSLFPLCLSGGRDTSSCPYEEAVLICGLCLQQWLTEPDEIMLLATMMHCTIHSIILYTLHPLHLDIRAAENFVPLLSYTTSTLKNLCKLKNRTTVLEYSVL